MAARIIGLDRLKKKLARMPRVVEAEIRLAMEQSAGEIVDMAKGLVPVESGRLRGSIGWTWGDAPEGAMVMGRVWRGGAGNMAITIYAGSDAAFYARFVEFGTSPHANGGLFAGSENPGTAAKPFFFPAYRAKRKQVRGRVSRAITKAAKRVAAGG